MEAGRNPNLLKLDVRSVEMFCQKSLISNQEAPRARSDDGLVFETKTKLSRDAEQTTWHFYLRTTRTFESYREAGRE